MSRDGVKWAGAAARPGVGRMITLYTFGPFFGLPDGSPFVVKAMLLLKFADLPFQEDQGGYGKAPKGKLPYIEDRGARIADSTFIRLHIERTYGTDFDVGLSPAERAVSWAVEKMCEDHLYWALMDMRWGPDANFDRGPRHFFDAVPAPARRLAAWVIRRRTLSGLRAQGLGRHSRAEIEDLAARDIAALSAILGDKPFLMGERPCAADAAVYALISGVTAKVFESPIRAAAEGFDNLLAYRDRITERYFPSAASSGP